MESDTPLEGTEPQVEESPIPPPSFGPGLRPIIIIPHVGKEPPPNLSEDEALATWVAVTAPWHPLLLAKSEVLPRIEDVEWPSAAEPRDIRLICHNGSARLPSGYRTATDDAGIVLLDGGLDRPATIAGLLERAGLEMPNLTAEQTELVEGFLALGAACWWLHDLTIAMGHVDSLDNDALTREALQGARQWAEGDTPAARNRLRAAFEVLTQARERFYPTDAYLVDICLLDPASRPEELADPLAARAAFTLLAPAQAIENVANLDPDRLTAFRSAIDEGWADLIGGAYTEVDEPLLPLSSILYQFRKGGEVYRANLEGRNVETLGRRRFGLYPQLPQIAKRFGFRFGYHIGFDTGKFPIRPEMKRLWEAPDGSTIEALNRPPIAGDRQSEGVQLPWRLAKTMKDDFTAALILIHWAGKFAPWFGDLRKALSFSPVFMRSSTVNDFFHQTDRPFETFQVALDEYVTPYLDQAVRRNSLQPISARAEHARQRARLDAVEASKALAQALAQEPAELAPILTEVEESLESGRGDEASAALDQAEAAWSEALCRGIVGAKQEGRPGYLIVNPVGVARRVAVVLPDTAYDLRPEGPLRAAQPTDEGVSAVVDIAAYGYAWVPRETPADAPAAPADSLFIKDRTLHHESMSITLDPHSGGILGVKGINEETARLGQQLVIVGLTGADGQPALSKMKGSKFHADFGGPALLQATTTGTLHHPADDRPLASFTQRFRLWTGRPALEIEIRLDDLDSHWLESLTKGSPWASYLACRWAWPDAESTLRRSGLLSPEATNGERPETPDTIDITSRKRRTSLLFGGLAHHRRIRPRMLDTLLIAGKESARTFHLGVALDIEHPWQATTDAIAPAFVVPTSAGPPKTGPAGWLVAADNKAIAIVGVSYLEDSGDGRGWGLAITLLETAGRAARCKVRLFRDPTYARQVDFNGEIIMDLSTDGDAVLVDLTPHELARIDVTLG
jgi:alpha-mannosidase